MKEKEIILRFLVKARISLQKNRIDLFVAPRMKRKDDMKCERLFRGDL